MESGSSHSGEIVKIGRVNGTSSLISRVGGEITVANQHGIRRIRYFNINGTSQRGRVIKKIRVGNRSSGVNMIQTVVLQKKKKKN